MLDENNFICHNYVDVYMQPIISTLTANVGVLVLDLHPTVIDCA